MRPRLSIIIPTYNRLDMLKTLLSSIEKKLGNFEYEVVISDDASSDGTKDYFKELISHKIVYIRNEKNVGVFKNFLNGVLRANANIVWAVSDDDDIGEPEFAIDGVKLIESGDFDLAFGRTIVKYDAFVSHSNIEFKVKYTPQEFLDDWFRIINHISFGTFLFKKELLLSAYPDTNIFLGNTIDYNIIYKAVNGSKAIAFVDKLAYAWTKSSDSSLSRQSRDDLLLRLMHIFAFPLANFSEERDYNIDFFNKYILLAIDTLVSNYHMCNNQSNFKKILEWHNANNIKKLYIYGRGEVGIMLKEYLSNNEIEIESFIEDTLEDNNCITYDSFCANNLLDENIGIALATYKCSVVTKMIAKLYGQRSDNVKTISLYALSREL